jgi:hypothetical protein
LVANFEPTDRRPIGFWLKLVDRLIDERLGAPLGTLSRRHWQVMNVVHHGPATQSCWKRNGDASRSER